ncbi:MAG TPA: hypothetical protein VKA15_22900, partial [Isosphaeraceae bacterium]|nr:hypothetical protein [Isosphaeraceae bacterium]
MATAPSTAVSPPSFDDRGRAVRLTEDEIREKNALALAALDAIEEIGNDAEQRETLDCLISRFPGIDARPWQAITSIAARKPLALATG